MLYVTDGMTDEQIDEWIRSQLVGGIRRLKIYNDKTNYKFGHGGNFNIWFFGAVTTEMTGIAIDHWSNQVFSIRINYPNGIIYVDRLVSEFDLRWIDITNECDWKVNINKDGIYRSFLRYNPGTKQIIGAIEALEDVENQQTIVILPYLYEFENGLNSYVGMCGIATCNNQNSMAVFPRVEGNRILSSHNINIPAQDTRYLINFVAI